MRIGIDARLAMARGRGWRRYATQFLRVAAYCQEVDFRVVLPNNTYCREFAAKIDTIEWLFDEFSLDKQKDYATIALESGESLFQNGAIDVLHTLTRYVPEVQFGPVLATVHDIVPLSNPPFKLELRNSTLAAVDRLVKYDAAVIAVSNFTKSELLKYTAIHENRIRVISPGVDSFRANSYSEINDAEQVRIPNNYSSKRIILYIGGAGENKNLQRLIDAVLLQNELDPVTLWIVGDSVSEHAKYLDDNYEADDEEGAIVFLGAVPDAQIPQLFGLVDLLVMPSLHEGFGLPLVEAMVPGVPVCCSDIPVFREVAENVPWYFDPLDTRSIQEALRDCFRYDSERKSRAMIGQQRSGTYLWEVHLEKVTKLYLEEFKRKNKHHAQCS